MLYLKQSTAVEILVGPFLDDTDGKTPETALTVASIDFDIYKGITKTDITLAASGTANDCVHVANGFYRIELTTTNTDTVGRFIATANIAGALPVWHEFTILPANVYDSVIGGTDLLQVDMTQVNGSTAVVSNVEDDYDGTGYAKANSTIGTVTTLTNKSGFAITTTEHTNIADAILKRDWNSVTGEASRSVLNSLRMLRNKISISGSTLTITKEDDATTAFTASLTTSAAADPITGIDPT